MIKLCEHPKQYQLPPPKRVCEFAGFSTCQKYKKPIPENSEGWRVCCTECEQPYYEESN